jgi:hypothetical protein
MAINALTRLDFSRSEAFYQNLSKVEHRYGTGFWGLFGMVRCGTRPIGDET